MSSNQLLVIFDQHLNHPQNLIQQYLQLQHPSNIFINNKYYYTNVNIHMLCAQQIEKSISNHIFHENIQNATVILFLVSSINSIPIFKHLSSTIATHFGQNVTYIFLIHDINVDQLSSYQLISWAIKYRIEIITQFLVSEQNLSISQRIIQILDCVKWISIKRLNINNPDHNHDDKNSSLNRLQQPTQIRRALNKNDLSRLTNQLLEIDDSEED